MLTLNHQAYNMFAVNGILFNHESPRRGETFVTRKITRAVAAIKAGRQNDVRLGNLHSTRDWGHARDYVECMWLMLQQEEPEDFVVATGETHSVQEFCEIAFAHAGMELRWEGSGLDEVGIEKATGIVRVKVDSRYFRPTEVIEISRIEGASQACIQVDVLLGNPEKARTKLKWNPTSTPFKKLVEEMVDADIEAMKVASISLSTPVSHSSTGKVSQTRLGGVKIEAVDMVLRFTACGFSASEDCSPINL
eukprot:28412-Hanusia_phi.AAC.9